MTYSDYLTLAAIALAAYYNWQFRRARSQLNAVAGIAALMNCVLHDNVPMEQWKQWVRKYMQAHQGEQHEAQVNN